MKKYFAGLLVLLPAILWLGTAVLVPDSQTVVPAPVGESGSASGGSARPPVLPVTVNGRPGMPAPGATDPESPAAAAWLSLEHSMRHDHRGLVEVTHPSGRRSVYLDGRFTQMSAAIPDESGRLRLQCFSDFQVLRDRLENPPPAINAPVHESPVTY